MQTWAATRKSRLDAFEVALADCPATAGVNWGLIMLLVAVVACWLLAGLFMYWVMR